MKAQGYAKRRQQLGDWTIEIETYQLGDVFYCTINNVDPGARFARGEGATREEAEWAALTKAQRYISQTRKFNIS
jgi:hypothetical protein